MGTRRSEILLHPVRLRIVLKVAGDELTTAEIAEALSDVPQATLYRHIARLADSGILDIVGERRTRGAIEKTYSVNADRAHIDFEDAGEMSSEDHLQAFTMFAGILIETYGRYLDTQGSDPGEDGVSFRQARLWMTDSELEELVTELTTVLAPYLDLKKKSERTPRLLSTILMPEPLPTVD